MHTQPCLVHLGQAWFKCFPQHEAGWFLIWRNSCQIGKAGKSVNATPPDAGTMREALEPSIMARAPSCYHRYVFGVPGAGCC